jgi:hypothetical protein
MMRAIAVAAFGFRYLCFDGPARAKRRPWRAFFGKKNKVMRWVGTRVSRRQSLTNTRGNVIAFQAWVLSDLFSDTAIFSDRFREPWIKRFSVQNHVRQIF